MKSFYLPRAANLILLTAMPSALFSQSSRADLKKPNILVILSDDMGYSDIGCFGSEIKTPNLDRLANNGIRFTQFYNTARCSPSRASLLTGLYPHEANMGNLASENYTEPEFFYCRRNPHCKAFFGKSRYVRFYRHINLLRSKRTY